MKSCELDPAHDLPLEHFIHFMPKAGTNYLFTQPTHVIILCVQNELHFELHFRI
jgi:hypothetical protein